MATKIDVPETNLEAVRRAMEEFPNESSEDTRDYIKRKWGMDIPESTYNVYHSKLQREAGGEKAGDGKTGAKRGRKPRTTVAPAGDVSREDLRKLAKGLRASDLEEPMEVLEKIKPLVDTFQGDFNRFFSAMVDLEYLKADEEPEEETATAEAEETPKKKSK